MQNDQLLIYGANGYTGALIARSAVARGMRPLLASRDAAKTAAIAQELGLDCRIAALDDPRALDAMLAGARVVLHCAGPFVHTAKPMADACLRNHVHYLDVTGEIAVFEALAARYDEAKQAGVMLLPGVGFDVVPSDCLAAHLNRRLPGAQSLVLGIAALGSLSRGTVLTGFEAMVRGEGGLVRRQGVLTPVPVVAKTRMIDFGDGPQRTVLTPWGDVATAFHSTGIPSIEVYMAFPPTLVRSMQYSRYISWMLRLPRVAEGIAGLIRANVTGPTEWQRAAGASYLWGLVEDAQGRRAESRMTTPEGYTLTAQSALLIAQKVLGGLFKPGYQTPSSAYGADLALELAGVTRTDV